MTSDAQVTQLLHQATDGDTAAIERLFAVVYDELRRLAQVCFARESAAHTLQPTALVHEAYLRLVQRERVEVADRREFFAVAAQAMRRILIDHARAKRRLKRGGDAQPVDADILLNLPDEDESYVLAIDEPLDELARVDEQSHRVVLLRFFAGLSVEQVAEVLQISPATVKRDWVFARAWLHRKVADTESM